MLYIDPRGVREGIALIFFWKSVFEKHPSLPPPAPLVFTPAKSQEDIVDPAFESREDSDWETIEDCDSDFDNDLPTIDVNCEDWAEQFTKSVQKFHNIGNVVNCENCGEVFTPEHQCWIYEHQERILMIEFVKLS